MQKIEFLEKENKLNSERTNQLKHENSVLIEKLSQ